MATSLTLFLLRKYSPTLSCLTYVSHLLRKIESEKAMQKEKGEMRSRRAGVRF